MLIVTSVLLSLCALSQKEELVAHVCVLALTYEHWSVCKHLSLVCIFSGKNAQQLYSSSPRHGIPLFCMPKPLVCCVLPEPSLAWDWLKGPVACDCGCIRMWFVFYHHHHEAPPPKILRKWFICHSYSHGVESLCDWWMKVQPWNVGADARDVVWKWTPVLTVAIQGYWAHGLHYELAGLRTQPQQDFVGHHGCLCTRGIRPL